MHLGSMMDCIMVTGHIKSLSELDRRPAEYKRVGVRGRGEGQ